MVWGNLSSILTPFSPFIFILPSSCLVRVCISLIPILSHSSGLNPLGNPTPSSSMIIFIKSLPLYAFTVIVPSLSGKACFMEFVKASVIISPQGMAWFMVSFISWIWQLNFIFGSLYVAFNSDMISFMYSLKFMEARSSDW